MPETGRQVYERLEMEGVLRGHDGKDIWIHPDSGLHVIGNGVPAVEELRKKVEQWLGQIPEARDAITRTFYSRRIGQLAKLPFSPVPK